MQNVEKIVDMEMLAKPNVDTTDLSDVPNSFALCSECIKGMAALGVEPEQFTISSLIDRPCCLCFTLCNNICLLGGHRSMPYGIGRDDKGKLYVESGTIEQLILLAKGITTDGDLVSKSCRTTMWKLGMVGRLEGWNFITPKGVFFLSQLDTPLEELLSNN